YFSNAENKKKLLILHCNKDKQRIGQASLGLFLLIPFINLKNIPIMNGRILQLFLSALCLYLFSTFDATAKTTSFSTESRSFSFLENKGQIVDQYSNIRPDIDFKISADGVTAFIGKGKIHYQWAKPLTTKGLTTEISGKDLLKHALSHAALDWEVYRMDVTLIGA